MQSLRTAWSLLVSGTAGMSSREPHFPYPNASARPEHASPSIIALGILSYSVCPCGTATLVRELALGGGQWVLCGASEATTDQGVVKLLRDSGVINSPHSGLIKKWTSRWTRNAALQSAFAFLEPGDLGTVVAAFFVSDVALASAAHSASTAALRAGGRRRVPLAATDIITAV